MKARVLFALILSALFLDICGAQAATVAKFAIGHSTINPRLAPLWMAQESGYFSKYGLEPTLVLVKSTPVLLAGMKSGSIPVAYGVGGSILGASVGEPDLKILATFSGKMTNNLIARPTIKTPKDLKGRIVGVQSIGGTNWIGAILWLEHLGLDPQRDNVIIQVIGDQIVRAQALETGKIDAAAVDTVFSRRLEQRAFNVLGDSHRVSIPFVGVDIAATKPMIAEQPVALENLLKALLESLAYILESLAYIFEPKNKSKVLELIMRRLKITDVGPAEDGYRDLLNTMSRKPNPGVDGLRNVQRLMKVQSPKIGDVKIEDLVDSRFIRKLDESGFIDGLFTTQPTR
jgi:ABC-type nitrate/sulfonate/bicarbonate transport system substrate-binding protein